MPRVTFHVDGVERSGDVDVRTTVLDLLREHLGVTAPKKGCDHGQCGSCTVLLDGRRHLTCLALAVSYDGSELVTAAGLGASPDELHPMADAFLRNDAFQCGYCTPGQICSAVGVLDEIEQQHPSHVTEELAGEVRADDDELRERMSGNLCRCGAYVNILAAVREVATDEAAGA